MIKITKDMSEWELLLPKISPSSRYRAKKRGYFYIKTKPYKPDKTINIKLLYSIAWKVWVAYYSSWENYRDDMIQESVIYAWEISGTCKGTTTKQRYNFFYTVIRQEMHNYIKRINTQQEKIYLFDFHKEYSAIRALINKYVYHNTYDIKLQLLEI